MLKQLQEIINNNKELDKYRIDCEEFNQGFIITIPEDLDYALLNLKERITKAILNKVIKNDLVITKIIVERGYPGYEIGVQAINIKKAFDEDTSLSAETLFKLKLKELEMAQ